MFSFIKSMRRPRTPILWQTDDIHIWLPALEKPILVELQAEASWIRSIRNDVSPTEQVLLHLGTILLPHEAFVNGIEYEKRLLPFGTSRLFGHQQLRWLVDNQDRYPILLGLLGEMIIDGPGLVVVAENGDRNIPYICKSGARWGLHWGWPWLHSTKFDRHCRIAFAG